MRPNRQTYAFLADDYDGVAEAQTLGEAGDLAIDGDLAAGGVATFTYPRIVGISSSGTDTGVTFTVYGTDSYGNAISEAVTGADASTAVTTKYFKTVTRIAADGQTDGDVTAGPSHIGVQAPILLDHWANPFHVTCYVTSGDFGDFRVSLQSTADDVAGATADDEINWTTFLNEIGSNAQAPLVKDSTSIPLVATAIRLITTPGSDNDSAAINLAVLQAGGGGA